MIDDSIGCTLYESRGDKSSPRSSKEPARARSVRLCRRFVLWAAKKSTKERSSPPPNCGQPRANRSPSISNSEPSRMPIQGVHACCYRTRDHHHRPFPSPTGCSPPPSPIAKSQLVNSQTLSLPTECQESPAARQMPSEVFNDFLAGCLGGVAGVLAGYPLDTVKVRLQTQNAHSPLYRGTFQCFRCIVVKEGPAALYKGMTSPLASLALVNALVFGVYGHVSNHFEDQQALRTHFFAGAAAGLAQTFISSPMELLKLRAQLPHNAISPAATPFQLLLQIVREKGPRHLSRGLLITQLRDCPAMGIYFASFDWLTRKTSRTGTVEGLSSSQLLFAGGAAGMLSWLANYPADVIKTRFQADLSYNSYADVLRRSWAEGGWRTFYAGLGSTLLRAFPTNAATFFAVEWTYRLLLRRSPSNAETAASILCPTAGNLLFLPEAGCTCLEPMLIQ